MNRDDRTQFMISFHWKEMEAQRNMADVEAQMDNFLMIQQWDLSVLSFSY